MKPRPDFQSTDTSEWAAPDEYNRLIRELELRSIRLADARLAAPPFSPELAPIDAHISMSARFEVMEGGFVAYHVLTLLGGSDHQEDPVIRVQAEYAVTYGSEISMVRSLFMPFEHLNLPVHTWPYFREFVQSALARLEWPQLTLPTLQSGNATLVDFSDPVFQADVKDERIQDVT